MENCKLGNRIESNGYIGTVRYIGEVPPTSDIWLGIEWDVGNRGKHNGTKNNIEYFKCKNEKGGSFVRPLKANFGVSICEAMKERYTEDKDSNDALYLMGKHGSQRKVEAVGMDQAREVFEQMYLLKDVGLRDKLISRAGESGLLSSMAANITHLDLSKNLLSSWDEVSMIAGQLKSLSVLNLSENTFIPLEDNIEPSPSFDSVKILILNKCKLSWAELLKCSKLWPDVEELHLVGNEFSDMSEPISNELSKVRLLNLSENKFEHWEKVKTIGKLPSLTSLLLINCELCDANISEEQFPTLTHISLTGNQFKDYKIFNELNRLLALDDLTMRNNPVLKLEDNDTMAEIIVAKIKNLKTFNRSVVDENERTGSELDYRRKFGQKWKESGGNQDPERNRPSPEFLEEHPRFMEIVEKYGAPQDKEILKQSTALKGNLIEVFIEAPIDPNFKTIIRKLPLSMTVGSLKLLLQRLTKTEIRKQRLVYVSKDDPNHVVTMQSDCDNLYDVSIQPYDVIMIIHPNKDIDWEARKAKMLSCR